ncbi:hypothetical protein [Streptomyces sp. TLI_171]|uniref:hypothetical protein n=1 Tax=Streptomyces sp. TLI_171 TaxID=1938859 RepID=UPI000C1956F8|nr:hypothetical protein [Streptomyces sp. TLI_171]RKE03025.1 hypothetical protein BX266_7632 [Streptomyces sp. TLI_171]
MSTAGDEALIGRSYTRARRSPLVIGKLPGAGRLPGGPYTITQIVTMVLTFVALIATKALWAYFGPGNVLFLIVVPWGLAFALRYARMDGRDPARALLGVFTYASTPRVGRLAGRPVRPRRPALVDTRITVAAVAPAPAAAPEPLPARRPAQPSAPSVAALSQASRPRHTAPPEPSGRPAATSAAAVSRPRATEARPRAQIAGSSARTPAARTALQDLLAQLGED